MEAFFTMLVQWLPYILFVSILLVLLVMLTKGAKVSCCSIKNDWYRRKPYDLHVLRGDHENKGNHS